MQKYTEAESNANAFALTCSEHVPSGGAWRARTHEYDGRDRRCKPSGLHGRGVNRVSVRLGKYRRSRWPKTNIVKPKTAGSASQKPRVAWLASQGGNVHPICTGGKCYSFAVNRFTFPGRTGEGCRQNGRRAESAISPEGKVLRFRGKLIHFPPPRIQHCNGRCFFEISWSNRKLSNLHKTL